ncbi:MAG TPA: DUF5719 family protein [Pseudolysinimonas sp.]|jgi:hypothetical protein
MPEPDEPTDPVMSEAPDSGMPTVPAATTAQDADDERPPSRPGRPGRARRAAIVGLRVVTGTVGVVAALAVIGAVGLLPLPAHRIAVPSVSVTPVPTDQTRLCAGGLLRLGDETGQNANSASSLGAPSLRADSIGASLSSAPLALSDADTGGGASAPDQLTIPAAAGATLSGAQSQVAEAQDFTGFAAAACAEPSGSVWLVGGSTAVGRTTLLTVANPSSVDATVALTILGKDGPVSAPGMSGIIVKSGAQRVIPLAGFAPDVATPVVHVQASGGQVVAYLQESIVRGLDAGGVDLLGGGVAPTEHLVIPGVRVSDAVGVNKALALPDWDDVVAAVRVAVPGAKAAKVQVSLVPQDAKLDGLTFEMDVSSGQVSELGLDSAAQTDTGKVAIPDGTYSVVIDADQPVVAGVRISTAVDPAAGDPAAAAQSDTTAPPSDFAWFAPASPLTGDTAVTIAPGPAPMLSATNPTKASITMTLEAQDGPDLSLVVPAGGSASLAVSAGSTYLLKGATGLLAAISFAGAAELAHYTIASAGPVSGPIVVHP